MKKPIDQFSLSDCRKAIDTNDYPLLTVTRREYEALVSRLEKARGILSGVVPHAEQDDDNCEICRWLASLERAK